MKGDQMGILAAYPTQRQLPLSNQTRFSICSLASHPSYFTSLHHRLAKRGIVAAGRVHDTPALFGWLVEVLSLQGISDAAAFTFMDQHGRAQWEDVARSLRDQPAC